MAEKTLRQLARAHAKGELNQEQYRKARADLLKGILNGEITLNENQYPSPVQPRKPDDTLNEVTERKPQKSQPPEAGTRRREPAPAGKSAEKERPPAGPPAGETRKWSLIAGVSGLVLLPVLIYLLIPSPAPESDTAPGATTETATSGAGSDAAPAAGAERTEAQDLIAAFLEERTWTRESIKGFISSWQALPVDQREAAHDSVELGRLTNAIYKQLLAEKALSDLDKSGKAMEKQRLLVEFARRLGIEDQRISLPDEAGEAAGDGQG